MYDMSEQYKKMDDESYPPANYEDAVDAYMAASAVLTKEKWMPNCTLCEADFINAITIYLNTNISAALKSDNYLLRVFAYMDRRIGKRTLIKIKDDTETLPEWVKQFYRIRCESEGL